MTNIQAWVGLLSGIAGFVILVVTNAVLLSRFFSQMTARFDILNSQVKSLKTEFRRDIDNLGDRVERALRGVVDSKVHDAEIDGRIDGIEERLQRLEETGDR